MGPQNLSLIIKAPIVLSDQRKCRGSVENSVAACGQT